MYDTTTISGQPATVAYLRRDGGWGPAIKVCVADTPEADAAAAAFFRRAATLATGHAACVDEEASSVLGPALGDVFFPTCEHGMDGHSCYGPEHFPSREQEMARAW
jgi:hypothetical protein